MKLLSVGPLPPTPTGIADYTADLLPHLASRVDVSVAVADDAPAPRQPYPTLRASELSARALSEYDAVLVHLGNHRFHAWELDLLSRWPCVVVLHDALLHHLYGDVLLARGRGASYLREVVYDSPDAAGPAAEVALRREPPVWYERPLLGRALDRSLGAIVHSRFAMATVLSARPRARARLVHHGIAEPAPTPPPSGPFVVGTFGGLTAEKRVGSVIAAFARLRQVVPDARLLLVGDESPALPLDALLERHRPGDADAVEVTGRVSLSEMEAAMRRCHVCVQLRQPTVGEASGVVLRALRLGRPTVVSDHGWFAELPADAAVRIPAGRGDLEEATALAGALIDLHDRPERAAGLAAGALAFVGASSWPAAADRYVEILHEPVAVHTPGHFLAL